MWTYGWNSVPAWNSRMVLWITKCLQTIKRHTVAVSSTCVNFQLWVNHFLHQSTRGTYMMHSMLLSWAVTSSLLPLSSRFQRISEECSSTWPVRSASFIWRQIVSAPRAFNINMQFISVVKLKGNTVELKELYKIEPVRLHIITVLRLLVYCPGWLRDRVNAYKFPLSPCFRNCWPASHSRHCVSNPNLGV